MFHRTPEKYKYTTANIIVGNAELPFVSNRQVGWITPGGRVISDKSDAIKFAQRMHELMTGNMRRFKRKRL